MNMAEQATPPRSPTPIEKTNLVMRNLCLEAVKNTRGGHLGTSSTPSSPPSLRKVNSVKMNCLCSPTTHAGSFRCRYHRTTAGLTRSSVSVASKLSELATNPNEMYDPLQAQ